MFCLKLTVAIRKHHSSDEQRTSAVISPSNGQYSTPGLNCQMSYAEQADKLAGPIALLKQ